MAPILFGPLSGRTTVNSVFSSAGAAAAAAAAGAAAAATGAAAETPHLDSKVLDEAGDFEDRLAGKPLDDLVFCDVAHGDLWLPASGPNLGARLRDVSPSLPRLIFVFFGGSADGRRPPLGKGWLKGCLRAE